MTTFFAYIRRLLVITLGFAVAVLVSTFVFFASVKARFFDLPETATFFEVAYDTAIMMFLVATIAANIVIVPVFILIILSEVFCWRRFLTYGVAGALIGSGGMFFAPTLVPSAAIMAGVASGIAGAWVYWLIAGCNAGKLFEQIVASRSQ
jgi:hypothetical protein